MHATVDTLNDYSIRWAELVAAVVWQSTLIAVGIGLVTLLLRRGSPVVRYWLWQIGAIKLLLMPLWTLSVPLSLSLVGGRAEPIEIVAAPDPLLPDEATLVSAEARAANSRHTAWGQSTLVRLSWQAWLFVAWLAILAAGVIQLAFQRVRLARLLTRARPADAVIVRQVERAAAAIGLRRVPPVVITSAACSPFACGLWRPKLVLPESLLSTLPDEQLGPVLLHELAHVKRRDLLWGWMPEIACRLYFFHPVAYWIRYRVRLEQELACDQLAIAHSGRGPAEYADILVRVVSSASEPDVLRAPAAARMDGGSEMIQ